MSLINNIGLHAADKTKPAEDLKKNYSVYIGIVNRFNRFNRFNRLFDKIV
jgi:hypothetical protein